MAIEIKEYVGFKPVTTDNKKANPNKVKKAEAPAKGKNDTKKK